MRTLARLVATGLLGAVLLPLAPVSAGTAAAAPVTARAVSATPVSRATSPVSSTAPLRRRVLFGAWVPGMTADPGRLTAFEEQIHTRTDIASYYAGYGDVFPGAVERGLSDGGRRRLLVSWDMGPTRFSEWTTGRHDDYLATIAAAARAYPYDVYVRPWPEMNGDWQSFQPTADGSRAHGGTYAEFVAAWRYLVTYLRSHGAGNLKWVFNPTVDTYAETTDVARIWPGSSYVDVLGIDGFNWGRDASWGRWRSFSSIFAPMYSRLTALDRTAPVWVCEFASKEPRRADGAPRDRHASKAAWLRQAMAYRGFPRLQAMVYFDERKERDWRVDSSRGALRAVRRALR